MFSILSLAWIVSLFPRVSRKSGNTLSTITPNLTIYCEANEKPADFDDTWNEGVKETKFGVTYEQYLELTSK